MVVRHMVDAERRADGGAVERIRIEASVDFDGAQRPSAQAAEAIVRESVVDIADRLFFKRDGSGEG